MYKKNTIRLFILLTIILTIIGSATSAGKVYLVIGSDTAIWNGMNTGRFNCTYNQSLLSGPLWWTLTASQ